MELPHIPFWRALLCASREWPAWQTLKAGDMRILGIISSHGSLFDPVSIDPYLVDWLGKVAGRVTSKSFGGASVSCKELQGDWTIDVLC